MSWLDQKPFVVTAENTRLMYGGDRERFCCCFCGKRFEEGDIARFVYCAKSPNGLTCDRCDSPDAADRLPHDWETFKVLRHNFGQDR